jgi:hypothetical protein
MIITLMGRGISAPQCPSAINLSAIPVEIVAANPAGQCCHLDTTRLYLTRAKHQNGCGRSDRPDQTHPSYIAFLGIED